MQPNNQISTVSFIICHAEGSSINDNIPQELYSVHYQSIQDAIAVVKQIGNGALLAKTDLENAYKQVPIHPDDFELLCYCTDGQFIYRQNPSIPVTFLKSLALPSSGYFKTNFQSNIVSIFWMISYLFASLTLLNVTMR